MNAAIERAGARGGERYGRKQAPLPEMYAPPSFGTGSVVCLTRIISLEISVDVS